MGPFKWLRWTDHLFVPRQLIRPPANASLGTRAPLEICALGFEIQYRQISTLLPIPAPPFHQLYPEVDNVSLIA